MPELIHFKSTHGIEEPNRYSILNLSCTFVAYLSIQDIMIHQASIIDANNTTVALLKEHRYESAIKNSSVLLKDYQKDLGQISISIDSGNGCLDACMLLSDGGGKSPGNKAFIYEYGILIPKSTDTNSTMVSAILIFNSALANHLCAETLETGTIQQGLLLKAKLMYELACHVHPGSMNLLFHFAVINNIAMIEAKMGHIDTSIKHFEYLLTFVMVLVDQGQTERLGHLQRFLGNINSITCHSAAAA